MEITGKIHEVGSVQNVTETFKKREVVIEYVENPQYPEFIRFEVVQDKVTMLDGLSIGAEVKVQFNLRGRAYTDKQGKTNYFNSLLIWKMDVLHNSNLTQNAQVSNNIPPVNDFVPSDSDDDDLPF